MNQNANLQTVHEDLLLRENIIRIDPTKGQVFNLSRLERLIRKLEKHLPNNKLKRIIKYKGRVIILGKINVGKSTLINAVFDLDPSDKFGASVNPLFPETQKIREYRKGSECMVLYDTPGFAELQTIDQNAVRRMQWFIEKSDLIVILMPYEFDVASYEHPLKTLEDMGGESILSDRTVFAITKKDLLLKTLVKSKIPLREYKEDYASRMNRGILKNNKFKITPDDLHLVDIHHSDCLDEFVRTILLKVSDTGFAGLIEIIKRKEISDGRKKIFFKTLGWFKKVFSALLIAKLTALL